MILRSAAGADAGPNIAGEGRCEYRGSPCGSSTPGGSDGGSHTRTALPPSAHRTQPLRPAQAQRATRTAASRPRRTPRLSATRRTPPAHGPRRRFHQKISNAERVLLAILYQRRLCTMDVLASLLGVCRSSIGSAIRETRPLLQRAGHVPAPAPARYRTGSDLLAATARTP